jgi:hypothetical protein
VDAPDEVSVGYRRLELMAFVELDRDPPSARAVPRGTANVTQSRDGELRGQAAI